MRTHLIQPIAALVLRGLPPACVLALAAVLAWGLAGCQAGGVGGEDASSKEQVLAEPVSEETMESLREISGEGAASDVPVAPAPDIEVAPDVTSAADDEAEKGVAESGESDEVVSSDEGKGGLPSAADLSIIEDYRAGFDHGPKPAAFQKYIVLHDTESDSDAAAIIDWWDGNGNQVAAHFIVNRDGTIWQCVPLDRIAHHAGYGDTGHNDRYGIDEDGRDDMAGSTPIGGDFADYAMNAWSVGIEMVHVGGEGDYPEEQLRAVDDLIAYIDASFGFESEIIDHKAWRSGNSDTSAEFADYLESYRATRKHA